MEKREEGSIWGEIKMDSEGRERGRWTGKRGRSRPAQGRDGERRLMLLRAATNLAKTLRWKAAALSESGGLCSCLLGQPSSVHCHRKYL